MIFFRSFMTGQCDIPYSSYPSKCKECSIETPSLCSTKGD